MQICQGKYYEQKRAKGICVAMGCSRPAEKDKRRPKPNKFCAKHRNQQQNENNMCRVTYRHLKYSAKVRNKPFTITYEYFEQWCNETGYLAIKGRGAGFYTVDRIKQELGYEPGNLQVKEHTQNIRKYYIDTWLAKKYGPSQATRQEEYEECDWNDFEWIDGEPVKKQPKPMEDCPF